MGNLSQGNLTQVSEQYFGMFRSFGLRGTLSATCAAHPAEVRANQLKIADHADSVVSLPFQRGGTCRLVERYCIVGVREISGTVLDAEISSDGDVQAVRIDAGVSVAGDFFVDCSGF